MKNKKFTPVYLYSDDFSIKSATDRYKKGAEVLNQFVEMTEKAIKENLDDEGKLKVKNEGMEFIINRVRDKFPFKEATDEFNLQAIGIDLQPLKQFYNRNVAMWRGRDYNLYEGVFEGNEEGVSKVIEKYKYYTQNQNQNIALEMAEEMRENILKVEKAGFIDKFNKSDISNVTSLLSYDYKGLHINYHHIRNLK